MIESQVTGCSKAERQPEVQRLLQQMESELNRAAELQETILQRLVCVLGDEAPGDPLAQPEEELTPLARQIRDSVRKLEMISEAYQRMLNRI